jgi:hypothetical protein
MTVRAMTYEPILVFDSREKWFPVGVEESFKVVGASWPPQGQINFPAGMTQPDLPPVGYHRTIFRAGLTWDQYWFWYLYNPWAVAGVGRHEGDWEFVQVGSGNITPLLVTASQHHSGGACYAWELTAGLNARPKIYVALGSHANYFLPGNHDHDRCDGKGKTITNIEWREFGAWAKRPGRWGNSTGEGKSPESPGYQGIRWNDPHLFHSRARAQNGPIA